MLAWNNIACLLFKYLKTFRCDSVLVVIVAGFVSLWRSDVGYLFCRFKQIFSALFRSHCSLGSSDSHMSLYTSIMYYISHKYAIYNECIHICMETYMYIHICIYIYIHIYIHTYINGNGGENLLLCEAPSCHERNALPDAWSVALLLVASRSHMPTSICN